MNAVTTDEVIYVPLSKLRVSEKNVRKKGGELGIEQLAAQIRAENLLQNLVVVASRAGTYEIVDGKRRYLALQQLAKEMLIDLDREVPVKVVPADHALSASLSAAFGQLPLHPVDRFEALKALVDEGHSVPEIASRFGVEERAIHQSLKLTTVAEPIIQAFRDDEISLEVLQAFTVSDDQERQLIAFENRIRSSYTPEHQKATEIRRKLTEKDIPDTDPRVALVGQEAYEQAGGVVRKDMFGSTSYFADAALLQRLAKERAGELETRVRAEGWSWVEVKFTGFQSWNYQKRQPKIAPTTTAQDAELAVIDHRRVQIGQQLNAIRKVAEAGRASQETLQRDAENAERIGAELSKLEARIEEISTERQTWSKKTLAEAGAVITVENGRLVVHRGLVDQKTAQRLQREREKKAKAKSDSEPNAELPAALHQRLTAHRSAVIRNRLVGDPWVALAVLLHSLIPTTIRAESPWEYTSVTVINGEDTTVVHEEAGVAPDNFVSLMNTSNAIDDLERRAPADDQDLLSWLLDQDNESLLKMLSVCVAASFRSIYRSNERDDDAALAEILVEHLDIDMGEHWQATAASYFSHVPKGLILQAVTETKGAAAAKALASMSREDAAAAAELHLEDEEWLPTIFRRTSKAPKEKATPKRKAGAKTPAHVVTQQEAVQHIQALLDAKATKKATGKKPVAKKVASKKAAVKKARKQ